MVRKLARQTIRAIDAWLAYRAPRRVLPQLRLVYGWTKARLNSRGVALVAGRLETWLGMPVSASSTKALARRLLVNYERWHIPADDPYWTERVRVDVTTGWEHVEAARAAGRGALLVPSHIGPAPLQPAHVGRLGVQAAIYSPHTAAGGEHNRQTSPIAFLREADRVLTAGGFFSSMGDIPNGRLVSVPFFGRRAAFPATPFALAARRGVPVLLTFALRHPDGRHEVIIRPPLVPDPTQGAVETGLVAAYACELEGIIRSHPDNAPKYLVEGLLERLSALASTADAASSGDRSA